MPAQFTNPQAMLPTWNPAIYAYTIPISRRNQVDPPRIITISGSTIVFDTRSSSTLGDLKVNSKLVIQTLGANPVYIAINLNAQPIDGGYHLIIPQQYMQIDLSADQPDFVSICGTDGDKVAVYISYPKESQPI